MNRIERPAEAPRTARIAYEKRPTFPHTQTQSCTKNCNVQTFVVGSPESYQNFLFAEAEKIMRETEGKTTEMLMPLICLVFGQLVLIKSTLFPPTEV